MDLGDSVTSSVSNVTHINNNVTVGNGVTPGHIAVVGPAITCATSGSAAGTVVEGPEKGNANTCVPGTGLAVVSANDEQGSFRIHTSTEPVVGIIATVNFSTPYSTAPVCTISRSAKAGTDTVLNSPTSAYYVSNVTASSFAVSDSVVMTATKPTWAAGFNYTCTQ